MITHTKDYCPYCKETNTILTDFSSGQVVYSNCGIVPEKRIIDETNKVHTFNNENPGTGGKDQNRVSIPLNNGETSLSVSINPKKLVGIGSKMSQPTSGSAGNGFNRINKRVNELVYKLNLAKSFVDKTHDLLSNVEKEKKLKGRSLDSIIASVIYVASGFCRVPRKMNDIVSSLHLDKKTVGKW